VSGRGVAYHLARNAGDAVATSARLGVAWLARTGFVHNRGGRGLVVAAVCVQQSHHASGVASAVEGVSGATLDAYLPVAAVLTSQPTSHDAALAAHALY